MPWLDLAQRWRGQALPVANGAEPFLEVGKANLFYRGMWSSNVSIYKAISYLCRSVPWLDKKNINLMRKYTWKTVVENKHGLAGEKSKFPMKYIPNYKLTKAE